MRIKRAAVRFGFVAGQLRTLTNDNAILWRVEGHYQMITSEARVSSVAWGPDGEYRVFVAKGPMDNLNGYVAVPNTHPWYKKHYADCTSTAACEERWCAHSPEALLKVHGGITYSGPEDGDMWVFGWDTSHWNSGVWTEAQVLMECYLLAAQLLSIAKFGVTAVTQEGAS